MIKSYLKTAIRNIRMHKGYSFINITGLAIGIAACLLILLFVQRELSFEKMFTKTDRIYRVLTIDKALGTNNQRVGITMPALGLVLISNLIAWPLAWFASKKWLESFAYRIDIKIWTFLFSALVTLLVAMLPVSYHSIRAACSNPVDSLKYE